ncbi:hypothetical protein ACR3K2_16670 [Cryptosporidium serpentis]
MIGSVRRQYLEYMTLYNFLYSDGDIQILPENLLESKEYHYFRLALQSPLFLICTSKNTETSPLLNSSMLEFLSNLDSERLKTYNEPPHICTAFKSIFDEFVLKPIQIGNIDMNTIVNMIQSNENENEDFINWDISHVFSWISLQVNEIPQKYINQTSEITNLIENYTRLALSIDYSIWDMMAADFLSCKNTHLTNISMNLPDTVIKMESLFFITMDPYCCLPSIMSLVLTLTVNSNIKFLKLVLNIIFQFLGQMLEKISPDLAELAFAISIVRMLVKLSRLIQTQCQEILQQMKNNTSETQTIPAIYIDRLLFNSFLSTEELLLTIRDNPKFTSSIIASIPSLELIVTILNYPLSNLELAKKLILPLLMYTVTYNIGVTGSLNLQTLDPFKDILKPDQNSSDYWLEIVLYICIWSKGKSNIDKFESKNTYELLICKIFSLFLGQQSTSWLISSSVANVLQYSLVTFLEDNQSKFLEVIPIIFKYSNSIDINSMEKLSFFQEMFTPNQVDINYDNPGIRTLIQDFFWLSPQAMSVILQHSKLQPDQTYIVLWSLAQSLINLQQKFSNPNFQAHQLSNIKITKNLDYIILAILDFVVDILKKNKNYPKIFENSDYHKLRDQKDFNCIYNYFEMFKAYVYARSIDFSSCSKQEQIIALSNLHGKIAWRRIMEWIRSWKLNKNDLSTCILNSRHWQTLFSELMAIVVPEALLVPSTPKLNISTYKHLSSYDLSNYSNYIETCLEVSINPKSFKNHPLYKLEQKFNQLQMQEFNKLEKLTFEWLTLYYLEPLLATYSVLKILNSKKISSKSQNFEELYYNLCLNPIKLLSIISKYLSIFNDCRNNLLLLEHYVVIICNIAVVILYTHEVYKHRIQTNNFNLENNNQSIEYQVLCQIWWLLQDIETKLEPDSDKYQIKTKSKYSKFVETQLGSFISSTIGRCSNVIINLIEFGLMYSLQSEESKTDIFKALNNLEWLVKIISKNIPQTMKEQIVLPRIANKLDKALTTQNISRQWNKYSIEQVKCNNINYNKFNHNQGLVPLDHQNNIKKSNLSLIENEIIHCVFLILWVYHLILEIPQDNSITLAIKTNSKPTFLPVAERLVVRILCITQDIITSKSENKELNLLINNFSIFLDYSSPVIISTCKSFQQLQKPLMESLDALQLIVQNSIHLRGSHLSNVINSIVFSLEN